LPLASALLAAALWSFSFHGVNMALIWVSGRTSLLVCLGALLTALNVLAGRTLVAAICCFGALLSKEEAVALPFLFAVWIAREEDGPIASRLRIAVARTWPLFAALAIYAVLRVQSDAFGPWDAPPYYRFVFAPGAVLRNLAEYTDRAVTWPAVIAILIVASTRAVPRLDDGERRSVWFGALWFFFGYALTILLPARSSLYALLPSIGACLCAAAIAAAAARQQPQRTRQVLTALLVLPLLLIPIYRMRNVRWVALADLSSHVMADARGAADAAPAGGQIILVDDPSARVNLDAAFGTLFPDAVAVIVARGFRGEIRQEPIRTPFDERGASTLLVFRLREGRLIQVPAPANSGS